jgi:hypothetical protein
MVCFHISPVLFRAVPAASKVTANISLPPNQTGANAVEAPAQCRPAGKDHQFYLKSA